VPIVKAFVAVAVTITEPPRLTEDPFIVIALLASCALVTVPDKSVVGIVVLAVIVPVPLPYTYPVRVFAPVPPLATLSVPPSVIAPEVPVEGVKPVDPALKDVTPPASENCLQDPAAYPSKVEVVVLNRN
jgi:hypothetical protein